MKTYLMGLQNAVVSVYDQTKTTLFGRAVQKTLNSQQVIGPALTGFIDWQTDLGMSPNMTFTSPNGRLFGITAPAGGLATVGLYTFDLTGAAAPVAVGKIIVTVPNQAATAHVLHQFKVFDGASAAVVTGWQIAFGTTGNVLINGSIFLAANIALSDFVITSVPTINFALSTGAKAVYTLQDPGNIGFGNLMTAIVGGPADLTGLKLYIQNGTVAVNQIAKFDLSVTHAVAGSLTVTPPASAATTWTTSVAHGFAVGDQIALTSTGALGAPWVVSTSALHTVYFIQSVGSSTTFTLSATSGGVVQTAAANSTGTTTVMHGFGQSTTAWMNIKTGNIAGFAGTFLLNNSQNYCVPTDTNVPVALQNQPCGFVGTNAGLYLYKLSDVTNGATTLPSLATVNSTGSGIDYTAITPLNAVYNTAISQPVYVSNASTFFTKNWINSQIKNTFGGQQTMWAETVRPQTTQIGATAVSSVDTRSGWLFVTGTTVGQRGTYYMDLQSDDQYGYTYVTSPVFATPAAVLKFVGTVEQLHNSTSLLNISYKTAATSSDPTFASPTTGWTAIMSTADLSGFTLSNYIQFRVGYEVATLGTATPAQLNDIRLTILQLTEISDNWEFSQANSTQGSPTRSAFQIKTAYTSGTVPKIYYRAYDTSNTLLVQADTVTNASNFQYSTDGGTTWLALGTVPNTVGTLLRYTFTSPPGVSIRPSYRES